LEIAIAFIIINFLQIPVTNKISSKILCSIDIIIYNTIQIIENDIIKKFLNFRNGSNDVAQDSEKSGIIWAANDFGEIKQTLGWSDWRYD